MLNRCSEQSHTITNKQKQRQPNNPKKPQARVGQTWQTRCAQKSAENLYGCITKQRMAYRLLRPGRAVIELHHIGFGRIMQSPGRFKNSDFLALRCRFML